MTVKKLECIGRDKHQTPYWICECSECGRKIILKENAINSTPNCGCKPKVRSNGKDLTGLIFGHLQVKEYVGQSSSGTMWRCLCSCGKETIVSRSNLETGNARSCGCRRTKRFEDLTGRHFGRLFVLEPAPSRNGKRRWKCQCDCGNITEVTTGGLKSGNTTSCGCLHREMVGNLWKNRRTK